MMQQNATLYRYSMVLRVAIHHGRLFHEKRASLAHNYDYVKNGSVWSACRP